MGVNLRPLVVPAQLKFEELAGKKIAVDGYLTLYQFLTTMPQLRDAAGRLTSHLSGLFFRFTHLMQYGIKLTFVLDGQQVNSKICPRLTSTIDEYIIDSSVKLLRALGIPVIQAPAEGEAQAAHMAKIGHVWAVASQDYDALMFGAPQLVRNLTIAHYRRTPSGRRIRIWPELILLRDLLRQNRINHRQLIALCMLIGTDFNPKVAGIGPKSAIALVRGKSLKEIFAQVKPPFDWQAVYKTITKMPVTDRYKLRWRRPNKAAIKRLLVKKHDFSEERVQAALEKITTK